MKSYKSLSLLVLSLSLLFLVSAVVFNQHQHHQLKAVQQSVLVDKRQLATPLPITQHEHLIDQKEYQTRAQTFFKKAIQMSNTPSKGNTAQTTASEATGTSAAFQAVSGVAGMANRLAVNQLALTFNEMANGTVVGTGTVTLKAFATTDDAQAQEKSATTKYTVLLTMTKYQHQWRVEQLKLGEVQESDNAKATIY